ncbi:MAG TPA: hypothetical protein VFO69_10960 [Allosphingosinicella sp.]|nr:hypothetical protein [Allosphingosinicella sp.]
MNILAFMLLVLVQTGPVEEETSFSDRQPVRLEPLSTDRAFSAFRDVCVTGFPDPALVARAAAAADLNLVQRDEPQRGALEWSSPNGHFVLRQAPNRNAADRRDRREGRAVRQRWQVRCDFWVALRETEDVPALMNLISHELAEGRAPVEEIVGASWDLGPDPAGGRRKLLFLPSVDDPRLFTLSLQRLADNSSR